MTLTPFTKKSVAILDVLGFVFRAYHALPPLTNARGEPVGALVGFMSMLLKWRMANPGGCLAVAFDSVEKTFRHGLFEGYKAKRPCAPEELTSQMTTIKEVCILLKLPILEMPGYEADDLLASAAHQAGDRSWEVTLVSSDKDLGQCLAPHVTIYDPLKEIYRKEKDMEEIWGVSPHQIAFVQALAGDTSDNVPGIPGIGIKTASQWVQRFGDLEGVLHAGVDLGSVKKQTLVAQYADQARLCYRLVSLRQDLPIPFESFIFHEPDWQGFEAFCQTHGLESMRRRYLALKTPVQVEISLLNPQDCIQAILEAGMVSLSQHGEQIWACWGENCVASIDKQAAQSFLADESCLTLVYQAKPWMALGPMKAFEDLDLMAYDAGVGVDMSLDQIYQEVMGGGLSPTPQAQAQALWSLFPLLKKRLVDCKTYALYETLDKPLVSTLHAMERRGIAVEKQRLQEINHVFSKEILELEAKIHQAVGTPFLISSPQQLGVILFEKLGWEGGKKTKSGSYSTHSGVLEQAAERGEVLAQWLLMWRQLKTLSHTFVKGLSAHIDPTTQRLSTTYTLTKTATGRLSSLAPNLQNIPMRTAQGRTIRRAFCAPEGRLLLSLDYSQIELRLLAHMGPVPVLRQAFLEGKDIHEETARLLLNQGPDAVVSPEERRVAKTINFAVLYGMSAYGLRQHLGVSLAQAQAFIQAYFEHLPGVEAYFQRCIDQARTQGHVTTLWGRYCLIQGIKNPRTAKAAQRQAINAPLQGTCADIVKKAMISCDRWLEANYPEGFLLLQVHDELLFEMPYDVPDGVVTQLCHLMGTAVALDVPLKVTANGGANWAELTPMNIP